MESLDACSTSWLPYVFSTLKTTRNFVTKTYHFTLVTDKRQFFVLLVAEGLYLSRLKMDENSRRTFFILFDGFRMFPRSQLDIKDALLFTPYLSILFHWPRISVGRDFLFFNGSFPNLSFSVSEMAVSDSKIGSHLKLKKKTDKLW